MITLDDIAALPMPDGDFEGKTIAESLRDLLLDVIDKQEGFNGKRPYGNSGWFGEFEIALVRGGAIGGKMDDENLWLESCDTEQAAKLINMLITEAFNQLKGKS